MQEEGIDQPGDQRPGLLGVPTPIVAPGVLCPDGTGQEHRRLEDEADGHSLAHPTAQRSLLRQPRRQPRQPIAQQDHDRQAKGDQERRVSDHRRGHVNLQPVALQRRHQVLGHRHLPVLADEIDGQQQRNRQEEKPRPQPPFHQHLYRQVSRGEPPDHGQRRLHEGRQRQALVDDHKLDHAGRQQQQTGERRRAAQPARPAAQRCLGRFLPVCGRTRTGRAAGDKLNQVTQRGHRQRAHGGPKNGHVHEMNPPTYLIRFRLDRQIQPLGDESGDPSPTQKGSLLPLCPFSASGPPLPAFTAPPGLGQGKRGT